MIEERGWPIRILQIVSGMNIGGAEMCLMNFLRHIDREQFRVDILVHYPPRDYYNEEADDLGIRVIPCPKHSLTYGRRFRAILRNYGHYDVVHSHAQHFGGYALRLAHRAGVPVRIAHSHSTGAGAELKLGLLRRGCHAWWKSMVRRHATHKLAVSRQAAANLFGADWESDPAVQVVYCGVDLTPFRIQVDLAALRAEWGIPPEALVLGHVGRLVAEKNHLFLLDIAAEVARLVPQMRLVLVGDGPLRPAVAEKARQLGLADRVIFAGLRSDVPRLMLGAMDLLLLPSLYEGLPMVLLEAQAAGLPCLCTDTITEEADVVPSLIKRVSLAQPPSAWAEAALSLREAGASLTQRQALAMVEHSPFNITYSVKRLESIYAASCKHVNR